MSRCWGDGRLSPFSFGATRVSMRAPEAGYTQGTGNPRQVSAALNCPRRLPLALHAYTVRNNTKAHCILYGVAGERAASVHCPSRMRCGLTHTKASPRSTKKGMGLLGHRFSLTSQPPDANVLLARNDVTPLT